MKKVRGAVGTGVGLWLAGAACALAQETAPVAAQVVTQAATRVADMPGGPRVNQLNLPAGVTGIAQDIAWLHWMMLIICTVIFIGVFGVMFYSIIWHRKSRGVKPAQFHEHVGVEVAWTVIPFLIVIGMALPATKTVVAMKDTSNADVTVKAVGYQWRWGYEYLDGAARDIKFISSLATPPEQIFGTEPRSDLYLMEVDNPMVVPVNKKIRVVVTAADVIHSWMVPDLGVKQDAIPGFIRDTWFRTEQPGEYRGFCAELCGKDHAFMPVVVKVLAAEDYSAWAAEQQQILAANADDPTREWSEEELIARGARVYGVHCVACHQVNGQGIPGAFAALDGSAIVQGPIQAQIDIVMKGKPGTAMAPFAPQLNDTEIAAVITYTRNSWGNLGKVEESFVQPAVITAAR